MKRLSLTQQRVLDLMRTGWELGVSRTIDGSCWLQEDGIGRGGKTETVSISTFQVLWRRGLLKTQDRDFPSERFVLVEGESST